MNATYIEKIYSTIKANEAMKGLKILLILFLVISGCKKENTANTTNIYINDLNPSNAQVLESVYLDNFGICFLDFSKSANSGYVIQNKDSFQKYQNSIRVNTSACDTASLLDIDFDKYSLVGILTDGVCSMTTEKQIINDISNKKYLYNIIVHTEKLPTCKVLVFSLNWAIVPKLPIGYKVQFNVRKIFSK